MKKNDVFIRKKPKLSLPCVDFTAERCTLEALYSWLTRTVAEWPIRPLQRGHMLWVISSEKTRLFDDEPTLQRSPRGRYKIQTARPFNKDKRVSYSP